MQDFALNISNLLGVACPQTRLENYVRFAGLIRKIFFFPFPFPLVKIILHDLTML
jgi:hypothetical protein